MAAPYGVELTQGAQDDLDAIHAHLTERGAADEADRLLDALLDRIEALEHFPHRGSVLQELEPLGIRDFRQLVLPPYRLIYRIFGQRVVILLIADGRRDMRSLLEWRLLGR